MTLYIKGTNKRIVGTKETLSGMAHVSGLDADDAPIWEGGTIVWWNEQKSVVSDKGGYVWVDEDGDEHEGIEIEERPDHDLTYDEGGRSPQVADRFRHIKRGSTYSVIDLIEPQKLPPDLTDGQLRAVALGEGYVAVMVQVSTESAIEMWVLYQALDGVMEGVHFLRPIQEFTADRFQFLSGSRA